MNTLDVERFDAVSVTYSAFFSLLNQAILFSMAFLFELGSGLGWFNVPFIILFLSMNAWTIFKWRRFGGKSAFKFYAKANTVCFVTLALLGLLLTCLAHA